MITTLFTGGGHASSVALPLLAPMKSLPGHLPVLQERAGAGSENAEDDMKSYALTRDFAAGTTRARFQMGPSVVACEVSDADPSSAALTISTSEINHPLNSPRVIETRTEGAMRSTVDRFSMDVTCTLLENGREIRTRRWQTEVKRELV
jgi:hypothetical protein